MKRALHRALILLLAAAACLALLAGCGKEESQEPAPAPGAEEGEAPSLPPGEPETEPAAPAAPGEETPGEEEPGIGEGRPDGPLSQEELRYFQEAFFNGEGMNIRNQFLSSLYEEPADIDLLELFYCGTGRETGMEDEEWADFAAAGGFAESDVTKVPAVEADAVLLQYAGLTLADTKGVGLDSFIYLPAYDAYYLGHGDTNYRDVTISSGEWKDGTVCLHYEDTFYDGAAKCVRLRETEEGGWQFLSNTYLNQPE